MTVVDARPASPPPVEPALRPDPPKSVRVPRSTLVVIAGAIVVVVMVQHWGLLAHDTRLDLLIDPQGFLSATWHLWDPTADMGRIQNQAVGYLFPMGPFFLVGTLLHLPPWVIERAWIAALLVVALWGMARLLDELQVGSVPARVVGALSYALSPLFIVRVGNTSVFTEGAAFVPLMLLPLVAGSRRGSPRRAAALSGLAVLFMGGVNAVVVAAALIPGGIWLLTRQRGPRRAALIRWWALAVVLATSWWAVPLVYQARYGIDFLPFTERAATTTTFTPPFEVLRGVGDWLSYTRLQGISLMSGYIETTAGLVIAGGALVVAVGLYGLAQRWLPERRFLVITFLVGAVLVGAGYGGAIGNPFAGGVVKLLDGPLGLFRNVYKFAPVVLLPVAVGVAAGVEAIASTLRRRHASLARAVPAVLAALVLLGAWPILGGDLLNHRGFESLPSWWEQARDSLQDSPGRTLILPGLPQSSSTWGFTAEEPLEWDNSAPFAVRQIAPLGSPGATRVLDTVEAAIESGGSPQLPAYLRRNGFSTVLVRNDGDWRSSGAPSPQQVTAAVQASGLVLAESFGPEMIVGDEPGIPNSRVRQIEVYEVPDPGTVAQVSTTPVANAAVVSGDAGTLLQFGDTSLEDRSVVLAQDLHEGDPLPPEWLVTDGNRRTFTSFGLNRHNRSYALTTGEKAPGGGSVSAGFLPTDRVVDQSVAVRTGINEVSSSSYGSWVVPVPEVGPQQAIDGDPGTAWAAAAELDAEQQWLRVGLEKPTDPGELRIRLLEDGPWRPKVTAIEVTTEAGSVTTAVVPDESDQLVAVAPGETSWIKLRFAAVDASSSTAGPGIRDVEVPGVTVDQRIAVPRQLQEVFTDQTRTPPTYAFTRVRSNPRLFLRRDEERELHRSWDQPRASVVRPEIQVSAMPGRSLTDLMGYTVISRVHASSTLGDLPGYAPRNLTDENPGTIWIAGSAPDQVQSDTTDVPDDTSLAAGAIPSSDRDPNPTVVLEWADAPTFDQLYVGRVSRFATPVSVHLATEHGEERTATIDPDGFARFATLTTNRIDVTFPEVSRYVVKNPDGTLVERPLALSDMYVAGSPGVGPLSDAIPVTIPCGSGPTVMIDGRSYDVAVDTTLGEAVSMGTVPARLCGVETVDLGAGTHTLDTTRSSDSSPFVVASVTLPPDGAAVPLVGRRQLDVERWDAENRTVRVGAGEESYLAVAENVNAGWRATLDGASLRPVTLDGWQQGFVVPAGSGGDVRLSYTPTAGYRIALVLGGLLVLGLLAMLLLRPRRPDPDGLAAGHEARWLLVLLAAGAGVALGGPLVVLLIPLVVLVRWRPSWPAAVAGAAFALAAGVVGVSHTSNPNAAAGAFGWGPTVLTMTAILAVAATLFGPSSSAPIVVDDGGVDGGPDQPEPTNPPAPAAEPSGGST